MSSRAIPSRIHLLKRAALGLCALFCAACSGTGDGGGGDPRSKPAMDPYGTCDQITDVNKEATWLDAANENSENCKQPIDHYVCVSGVTVVAIDKYDETGDGASGNYYVQDSLKVPVPYSGMTLYAPSFSPPDLRLGPGDVVDVAGTFTEFIGPSNGGFGECRTLPEIGGAVSLRFEDSPPKPTTIALSELYTYATARKYIGMLVRVENVLIADKPSSSGGRYTAILKVDQAIPAADVPRLSNELFALQDVGLDEGQSYSSVTGVLTYFYGFKIAPRDAADLVP